MKGTRLISDPPRWLRQRRRADGTWRIWWEPITWAKELGFEAQELDPDRLTWSVRRARELNTEADRAKQGKAPRSSGGRTLEALIELYRRDPMFTGKSEKTQASYRGNLNIICAKWGAHPVTAFSKPVLREWYLANCKARGETQAARLNAMMSILFSFAELKGWRPEGSNPCARLSVASSPSRRSRVATWHELDACTQAAQDLGLPSMAIACRLSCLQGQSQSNVIAATPSEFRRVTVRREGRQVTVLAWNTHRTKTGRRTMMEIHPELADDLGAWLDERPSREHLLIEERLQRPYSEDLFQRRWQEVRARAAERCPSIMADGQRLQFRDFRRTFAVWARNGGASVDDTADVLANSAANNPAIEDTYMPPSFDTASRAVRAVKRPQKSKREA